MLSDLAKLILAEAGKPVDKTGTPNVAKATVELRNKNLAPWQAACEHAQEDSFIEIGVTDD